MSGRSRIQNKDGVPTQRVPRLDFDVVLIQVVAEWGPLQTSTVCTSWPDYQRKFRGLLSGYQGPISVKNLFDGGVKRVIVNRIVHMNGTSPASAAKATHTQAASGAGLSTGIVTGTVAGPFTLANGQTLSVALDGAPATLATFACGAATLQNGVDGPWALTDGDSIFLSIDGGTAQEVVFNTADFVNIAAATPAEVAAVIQNTVMGANATASATRVTVTSVAQGTGASVNLVEQGGGLYGTDANSVLQFPVATVTGTGDCANNQSVTAAEIKTWLEAAIAGLTCGTSGAFLTVATNTAGAAGSIQIAAVSTMDTPLGLDNLLHQGTDAGSQNTGRVDGLYYGALGNRITYTIRNATNTVASSFDFLVYLDGVLGKEYINCNMDAASDDYWETKVNVVAGRSTLVAVVDLDAGGTFLQRRPDNVTAQALSGGSDGLSGLATSDFLGTALNRTGLHTFRSSTEGDIILNPEDTSVTCQDGVTAWCETEKQGTVYFVPDPPVGGDRDSIVAHEQQVDVSEKRAGFLPCWVYIPNPDTSVYGNVEDVLVPPSALWVGRMATNSRRYPEKMGKNPGNSIYGLLDKATGIENEEFNDESVRDYITDYGINPMVSGIRPERGDFRVWVDDVQGGDTSGDFKSVGEQRFVCYVKKSLQLFMNLVRTQAMGKRFYRTLERGARGYLVQFLGTDVYASEKADEAFMVDVDRDNEDINSPQVQEAEEFYMSIGLATARAGRFGYLTVSRDDRLLQSYIDQRLGGNSN